jgi:hypothetical protein
MHAARVRQVLVVFTDGIPTNKTAAELSFLAAQKKGVIVMMVLIGFWATMVPPPNAWSSYPPINVADGFTELENSLQAIQSLVCAISQPVPDATKVPATIPTLAPADVSTGAPCAAPGRTDVIFLLDASGSISPFDWASFRAFTDSVIAALPISAGQMHAGVLEFSTDVRTVANLTASTDDLRKQFQAKLSAAPSGRTNVHLGLDLAVSMLLAQDKAAIKRVLLFTDGLPTSMPLAEQSFLAAKAAGVIVQVAARTAAARTLVYCRFVLVWCGWNRPTAVLFRP